MGKSLYKAATGHDIHFDHLTDAGKPLEIVLDTDTKNEIDDQFAVVYALLSENIECHAIYAAPFYKQEYPSAKAGMEASYEEIQTVLERMGDRGRVDTVLRGATTFVSDTGKADDNPAVRDIIDRCTQGKRQVVVAIGALTNIASALLLEPKVADNMVLLWLGGQPLYWPDTKEFNLSGDVRAAQIVFDSNVAMVHFPCRHVAEKIVSVPAEMDRYVRPCGEIGAYLADIFEPFAPGVAGSKVIWDLAPLAWLNNPDWVASRIAPRPILNDDETWDLSDSNRMPYRVAFNLHRDAVMADFVRLIQKAYA